MDPSVSHAKLADNYFEYLARCFPVMCASDEFHFVPRAMAAAKQYDQMESLGREEIHGVISDLKEFQSEFKRREPKEADPEKLVDLALLHANAAGILIELEHHQTWQHNPLLYLKIACIGLDHALDKPSSDPKERLHRVLSRLNRIPSLLKQGIDNIQGVPETYHQAASVMIQDCAAYLDHVVHENPNLQTPGVARGVADVHGALKGYERHLRGVSPVPDNRFAGSSLQRSLREHFLSTRPLDEIFHMAVSDWDANLNRLETLRLALDSEKSWQEIYHGHRPEGTQETDTFVFYEAEIRRICSFFETLGFGGPDICQSMVLAETPIYLRSVRSGASFGASLTADMDETSYFFVTTRLPPTEVEVLRKRRFHREYRFLIAHEAVPGHHYLDSVRRRLENPVRRQIESPLFYEGWAAYAESLLFEYGYMDNPMEHLVDCKRRLWRSARCQIDVGLPTGLLTRAEAVSLLTTAGFSTEEAVRQIDRFSLNPGYQLCYSLGSNEIRQLRETFRLKMNKDTFYRRLLDGGELPFHLMEQHLERHHTEPDPEE
jgi:hypothetical protein